MTKSKLNKSGWTAGRYGLKREGKGENGKGVVTIPWNFLKKESTSTSGVKHITSKSDNLDVYVLDKKINGECIQGVFDTKRDALKHFDKALLARGRDPKFIFKKT